MEGSRGKERGGGGDISHLSLASAAILVSQDVLKLQLLLFGLSEGPPH